MEGTKDWLDNLKVRLSYGTVGNDGISSDLWSQTWTSETDLRYQYILNNQYSSSYDLFNGTKWQIKSKMGNNYYT